MNKAVGAFSFVLHSHIPYVLSHGKSPHGTDWLCEAAGESYMPLLDVCHRLIDEGISPKITLGLTPVLIEQLGDDAFKDEFAQYLELHISQAAADQIAFRASGSHHMANLAWFWVDWYRRTLDDFNHRWNRDLVGAFRALQDEEHIAILAGNATHAYTPLLDDANIASQMDVGIAAYRRHFGRNPRGYWLPECAYRPARALPDYAPTPGGAATCAKTARSETSSQRIDLPGYVDSPSALGRGSAKRRGGLGLDELLAERGIEYFFAESEQFRRGQGDCPGEASSDGVYGDRFDALTSLAATTTLNDSSGAPVSPYHANIANSSGRSAAPVRVFARDPATGVQVWSGESGYPGDPWYMEFHKHQDGKIAHSIGLRYWRITDRHCDLGQKEPYEPYRATARVAAHAEHFAALVHETLTKEASDGNGIVCSVYDTELFGHWWFEGPQFLYAAIKAVAAQQDIARRTCDEYLDTHGATEAVIDLPASSWGAGGDDRMWMNDATAWAWELIHQAEISLRDAVDAYATYAPAERLLKQAKRELMLMSSSDWLFCITTGVARDYATIRIRNHCDNFTALIALVHRVAEQGIALRPSDLKNLAECERTNRVFGEIGL